MRSACASGCGASCCAWRPRARAFRNGVVIQPAPTHYEIAARIGSHREAVTREFNRLESENIIEVRRKQIRIIDIQRLKQMDVQ